MEQVKLFNHDLSISVASLILSVSLIPQIVYSVKNKRVDISSLTIYSTLLGIALLLWAYSNMEFWFSFWTSFIVFACWLSLMFLKCQFERLEEYEKSSEQ